MRYHLYYYISGLFIMILALITIAFDWGSKPVIDKTLTMFPSFTEAQQKIDKIDIRLPNITVTLIKVKGSWLVMSADDFPADTSLVKELFKHVEKLELVRSKTQISKYFPRLGLLNPSLEETREGEGIRLTLSIGQNNPYADFIIGERLKSYHNTDHMLLFTRYAAIGGAYLVQSKSDFQYHPSQFLTPEFGMPKVDEVMSINLEKNGHSILKALRANATEPEQDKKISFMPPSVPKGKKLVYPDVLTDYVYALTQQLRPLDALTITLDKSEPQNTLIFELTRGRLAKIYFWQDNGASYMRIIRDDVNSPHNYYIYKIENSDYEMFVQPLGKFLQNETGT